MSGRLVLAATPIGDPEDASVRLSRLIETADLIAAEDTRRFRRLAAALGITPQGRVISNHEHNEDYRSTALLEVVAGGGTVLVVSDAGMPGVSDPGLKAVQAVVEAGFPVTALPGPSAALTALALSGLPTDRFCFEGFPPRTNGKRATAFRGLGAEPRTMIFFESPRRTADTLVSMAEAFGGDRQAAVCRELTKTYEEVKRGPLADLAAWASESEVLGEISIVVGGAPERVPVDLSDPTATDDVAALVAQVQQRVDAGERLKEAVAAVSAQSGVNKRGLYDAAVRARD
ncbi:16S rRNA (cytidine(1402)-2'-O)-methyltransferase [Kineosporia sp. NBRC 101731]|uniref:16S rRNA (cytidine(1402)-2'-O)-methyltransferase n=1 Tax=Kineosporia sp. NBRC 101731 TaxID=3032199 RepID=UPI0024A36C20|nr:16S rRNA (cytidine(1402)-2'-O)-methyltransferase [Kineosporia sp. NBRC 101731]GLY28724.1 ribosomal RNA small subunit methyltransferase I [Kineosporia sp. NBRC 101731]